MLKLWVLHLNRAKQNWVFSFNDYFPFFSFFWTFTACILRYRLFCVPCACAYFWRLFSPLLHSFTLCLLCLAVFVHFWNGSIKLSCNLYPCKWFLLVFNSGSVRWKLKLVVGWLFIQSVVRTVKGFCMHKVKSIESYEIQVDDATKTYTFFLRLSTGPFDTKLFNRKINEPYRHRKKMCKKKCETERKR